MPLLDCVDDFSSSGNAENAVILPSPYMIYILTSILSILFHSSLFLFIPFHYSLFSFIPFHSILLYSISFLSTLIHFNQFLSSRVHYIPFLSILIHCFSIFFHFFLFLFIHSIPAYHNPIYIIILPTERSWIGSRPIFEPCLIILIESK